MYKNKIGGRNNEQHSVKSKSAEAEMPNQIDNKCYDGNNNLKLRIAFSGKKVD